MSSKTDFSSHSGVDLARGDEAAGAAISQGKSYSDVRFAQIVVGMRRSAMFHNVGDNVERLSKRIHPQLLSALFISECLVALSRPKNTMPPGYRPGGTRRGPLRSPQGSSNGRTTQEIEEQRALRGCLIILLIGSQEQDADR